MHAFDYPLFERIVNDAYRWMRVCKFIDSYVRMCVVILTLCISVWLTHWTVMEITKFTFSPPFMIRANSIQYKVFQVEMLARSNTDTFKVEHYKVDLCANRANDGLQPHHSCNQFTEMCIFPVSGEQNGPNVWPLDRRTVRPFDRLTAQPLDRPSTHFTDHSTN